MTCRSILFVQRVLSRFLIDVKNVTTPHFLTFLNLIIIPIAFARDFVRACDAGLSRSRKNSGKSSVIAPVHLSRKLHAKFQPLQLVSAVRRLSVTQK